MLTGKKNKLHYICIATAHSVSHITALCLRDQPGSAACMDMTGLQTYHEYVIYFFLEQVCVASCNRTVSVK